MQMNLLLRAQSFLCEQWLVTFTEQLREAKGRWSAGNGQEWRTAEGVCVCVGQRQADKQRKWGRGRKQAASWNSQSKAIISTWAIRRMTACSDKVLQVFTTDSIHTWKIQQSCWCHGSRDGRVTRSTVKYLDNWRMALAFTDAHRSQDSDTYGL